ncbi:hypothetical protein HPP92_001425 [Vanilla planifolia]|uniref:Plus3 domain-containing protein n=1 Tax=Vanilla planifolia TaxID=51239 RepID=A0A835VDJ1_VANPL|nr:hypothetical protein HPP92_001425 [Vanilla planifolia]
MAWMEPFQKVGNHPFLSAIASGIYGGFGNMQQLPEGCSLYVLHMQLLIAKYASLVKVAGLKRNKKVLAQELVRWSSFKCEGAFGQESKLDGSLERKDGRRGKLSIQGGVARLISACGRGSTGVTEGIPVGICLITQLSDDGEDEHTYSLVEELLDDIKTFNDKVVGSFVRIKISNAGQRQDLYRLVQVVGTHESSKPYKVGKKTTDIMLEILNLDKKETSSIDSISNQEFTEVGYLIFSTATHFILSLRSMDIYIRRKIASVKIKQKRGYIQEKAMVLHAVRVNDETISKE